MKKYLALIVICLFLSACSNSVSGKIKSNGEEIVNIIDQSHMTLTPISEEDQIKVNSFFESNGVSMPDSDGNFKSKDEEYLFTIKKLWSYNEWYLEDLDEDHLKSYELNLNYLKENFNIEISEDYQ